MNEREQLEQVIATLQAQRAILGDAAVEQTLAALEQRLAELSVPSVADQRRQVTVLFAEVVGLADLSERLSPEAVQAVTNSLWVRLDQRIAEQGGTIDKHMGQEVMALWGAQRAREDDAERAILAALAMREELAAFVQARELDSLHLQIGINTGPAMMGRVGTTGEYTAMGDTVNVASRLEHTAPADTILIAHDTYRHVRGVFVVQALEPIFVKGRTEPVQAYRVERAKPRAFRVVTRGVEGIETRMIGREAEFKALQDAFYEAVEKGQTRALTILGEAGVGKSRLLYEFTNWIDLLPQSIRFFKGRATLQMSRLPYALIRDLFSFRFEILESDSATTVRSKLEQALVSTMGEPGRMRAHFIGHLLGFDFSDSPYLHGILADARQLHDRALIYLSEFFAAVALMRPTVIFLEDIHWADDRSLDLMQHVVRSRPSLPLLVLYLSRRSLFERRPDWGEGQPAHQRLDLLPLPKEESQRLVEEILRKVEDVPPALENLVVNSADGNPYFVEELIKMLIEDGVIVKGSEQWRVEAGRLADLRVPPTLTGILQARLDSLDPEERLLLQRASVVGRIFWDDAVEQLRVEEEPSLALQVEDSLKMLCERELIFKRAMSAFADTEEHIFKHALLRDVTYESVLRRLRRRYHAQVAEWLVARSGERVGEYTGVIAEHYEQAGEKAQAISYLTRAGEQALHISAYQEARPFFERALKLALELADSNWEIVTRQCLGETLWRVASYEESCVHLERSLALARAGGTGQQVATALLHLGKIALLKGEYEEAGLRLNEALALARPAEWPTILIEVILSLGNVAWRMGNYEEASTHYLESLSLAQAHDDRLGLATSLHNLGHIASARGDYAAARAYYEEGLAQHQAMGNRVGVAGALNSLGNMALTGGAYEEAKYRYEESLAIDREISNRYGMAIALSNLGETSVKLGQLQEAKAYYEESLALCREMGNRYGIAYCLGNLGDLCCDMEAYGEARETLAEGLRTILDVGAIPVALRILTSFAKFFLHEGQQERSLLLLGLILHHPTADSEIRQDAEPLLAALRTRLPPEQVSAGVERGKSQPLEEVATAILASFSGG